MILYIILLIIFLMLLILMNFFTIYFIIPSIKDNKNKDDPLIPKTITPQTLPKQRLITPYETINFIENLVKPIPMNEKIRMLNETSESINNFYVLNKKSEGLGNISQTGENQENPGQETSNPENQYSQNLTSQNQTSQNPSSQNQNSKNEKKDENTSKKDFKIWGYCYKILKRFKII